MVVLIAGDSADGDAMIYSAAAGAAGGIALGMLLTRNLDLPDLAVQMSVTPEKGGASAMVQFEL